MTGAKFWIVEAIEPGQIAGILALFRAYAASLPIDLAYQNFEEELASLPGMYRGPAGALLLARGDGGEALGCVGVQALSSDACEMKRLYVTPEGRGIGLGRALALEAISRAAAVGYAEMRLDTLPSMAAALALYESLGFERTAAYYDTPIARTLFLRRRL